MIDQGLNQEGTTELKVESGPSIKSREQSPQSAPTVRGVMPRCCTWNCFSPRMPVRHFIALRVARSISFFQQPALKKRYAPPPKGGIRCVVYSRNRSVRDRASVAVETFNNTSK
jgi:hypothetical protein